MPLNVAVLAHIRHPIAQPFRGGMEAHTALLCDGLRAKGHDVVLFAANGSDDPHLCQISAEPYESVLPWEHHRGSDRLARYQLTAFRNAFETIERGGFDVVHANMLFPQWLAWMVNARIPCVFSQHVPPFGAMREAVQAVGHSHWIQHTVTSRHQLSIWREQCDGPVPNMQVVHNGVNTAFWRFDEKGGERLVWTGRITPNKGVHLAIEAARRASAKLDIFGPVEDRTYFQQKVRPLLGGDIEFHGHADAETLRQAVGGARAILSTPMWDEPFGLGAAEALSCGTPVISFDRGALREVVGDCGIIVPPRDVREMADAITTIGSIDRAVCRRRAVEQLSVETMIAGYEARYDAAISGAAFSASKPSAARSSSHSRITELLA